MTRNSIKPGRALLVAAVGSAALSLAAPLYARDDVSTRYAKWEQRLRNRVDFLHTYPKGDENGATGDVFVSFQIGQNGVPTDIVLSKSSGHAIFDRAATRLVSYLGWLGPVPSTKGNIDRVTLKLSYGDPPTVAESERVAKADTAERLTNERRDLEIVSNTTELAERH